MEEHNYMKKLMKDFPTMFSKIIARPDVYIMEVKHDDWCKLYNERGSFCDCDPEIDIQDAHGTHYKKENKGETN